MSTITLPAEACYFSSGKTSNPASTVSMMIIIVGGRSLESVVAEIIGVTEIDIRSIRQVPEYYQLDVTTWNRRRFRVDAATIKRGSPRWDTYRTP